MDLHDKIAEFLRSQEGWALLRRMYLEGGRG